MNDKFPEKPMSEPQAPMRLIGIAKGTRWYFADDTFTNPGIYFFDGTANINVTDAIAAKQRHERIAFLNGQIEGITLYAVWKDGEQLVGCMQNPLKQVLDPYEKELASLKEKTP